MNNHIESDELSGCTANCLKNEAGEYAVDGTIETTWVDSNQWGTYCLPKCPEGQFTTTGYDGGKCRACDYNGGHGEVETGTTLTKQLCSQVCPNREIFPGSFCVLKDCPDGMFKGRYGRCENCNKAADLRDEILVSKGIEECNQCGNRIAVKYFTYFWRHLCVPVDPGKSGICNSVENNISELNADLVRQSQPYLNGNYDGKLFRGFDGGTCHSCNDKRTYQTTQEQCNSCYNRRWSNNNCIKGLCEEGHQFLNANGTCVACSNKNDPIDPNKENLCSSCSNRRQLEMGSIDGDNWVAKCVETCAGAQWQDINGNCLLCEEGGNREIGTDTESRSMCNKCDNRQAVEKKDTDGNTIGYHCEVVA